VPVGYGALVVVYVGVAAGVVWILRRLAKAPLDAAQPVSAQATP
jgi:hypothetical protein